MESINKISNILFIGDSIDKLRSELPRASLNEHFEEEWIKQSEKIIFFCNNKEIDDSTSIIQIVRYLRASFYWSKQDWSSYDREIIISLDECPSAIFHILKAFYYIQPLTDIYLPFIDAVSLSQNPNLRNKILLLKKAEAAFKNAEAIIKDKEDKVLRSTIAWVRAWMAYKLKNKDVAIKYSKEAWKLDGCNLGEGWTFWAQWVGKITNPLDGLEMLEGLK